MRGIDSQSAVSDDPQPIVEQAFLRLDGVAILLVDDSSDNLLLFQRILRGAGASVDIARDGNEAIALNRNGRYDVILMDLMMPNLDGYEATRLIREEGCGIPIVALTAHASRDAELRCRAGGFNDFAVKPIARRELIGVVAASTKATCRDF